MYFDRLGYKKDRFAQFDDRCRLIVTVLLIAAMVSTTSIVTPCVCILLCLTVLMSDIRVTVLRLLPVNIMVVALWLPVIVGFNQDKAFLYTLRINCAALLYMCFIGPLNVSRLASSMTTLKTPEKLVALFILTHRYIYLLYKGLSTALISMKLRLTEHNHTHTWRSLSAVFATTLTRAVLRAEIISSAMINRGFDGGFPVTIKLQWKLIDSILLAVAVSLAAFVFIIEAK